MLLKTVDGYMHSASVHSLVIIMLAASMLVASLPVDIEKRIQIYEHVLIIASMLADSLEKCVCYSLASSIQVACRYENRTCTREHCQRQQM